MYDPVDNYRLDPIFWLVYFLIGVFNKMRGAESDKTNNGAAQTHRHHRPRRHRPPSRLVHASDLPLQNPIGDLRTAFQGGWSLYLWIPLCALLTVVPGILLGQALNIRPEIQTATALFYIIPMFPLALVLVRVADQDGWSYQGYISLLILFSSCWAIFTTLASFGIAMGGGE